MIVAVLVARVAPAQVPESLCEPPRLGVVLKGGSPAIKTAVGALAESLLISGVRAEIVILDALPTKSAKVAPPRFVIVLDDIKSAPTTAVTHEYGAKGGQTSRIRWRGASGQAHALLYACAGAPEKIGEFLEIVDRSDAPDSYAFGAGESKKEIVIDPQEVMADAIEYVTRRALATAEGIELWRHRAELGQIAETVHDEARAAFWNRAAWTVTEPEPARAVVPWRSLERAALATWRSAYALAKTGGAPASGCAWCGAALQDAESECACPNATALRSALLVLKCAPDRWEHEKDRAAAMKIEVPWDKLLPSSPPESSTELDAVEKRLDAEHAADLANLRRKLEVDEVLKAEPYLDWYVILSLREPLRWAPADPDLVRHAARSIQAFYYRSGVAGASFDVESDSPAIGLVRRRTGWEYSAVEKREFSSAKTELLESFLERVLWTNARGIPKAP
jgi:hypothetical protein